MLDSVPLTSHVMLVCQVLSFDGVRIEVTTFRVVTRLTVTQPAKLPAQTLARTGHWWSWRLMSNTDHIYESGKRQCVCVGGALWHGSPSTKGCSFPLVTHLLNLPLTKLSSMSSDRIYKGPASTWGKMCGKTNSWGKYCHNPENCSLIQEWTTWSVLSEASRITKGSAWNMLF